MRVLFAGHDLKFINGLINLFKKHPDFEVKIDLWLGHNKHKEKQSQKMLDWANVIIAEWCLGNAEWYSKHKRPDQKLFIRFHKQELFTRYPENVNIQNVNQLIFIAPYIKEQMERKLPKWKQKSSLIFNAVEVQRFDLPKTENAYLNIGMLGICPKYKRLDKAFEVFKKVKEADSRFTFYVKSGMPKEYPWLWSKQEERDYYMDLFRKMEISPYRSSIVFEGWDPHVYQWFQKIGFLLSTSDIEGSHQAVAESMSSGTIPFIHGWKGPEFIYPKEFIKGNLDEIVEEILLLSQKKDFYTQKRQEVVEYSFDHFDSKKIFQQWLNLI